MKTVNILSNNNLKIIDNYKEILNTDYIFIPIKYDDKILVKFNSHVLKGELVYDDGIKKYSSVSGLVLKVLALNNFKYLVIKNDFKEESKNTRARNLDNLSKDKFLSNLNNQYIYNILNSKVNNLYINGIDDDPYIYNKYMIIKNNINDIAEMFKYIKDNFEINNIKLVIKNSYSNLLENYKINISYTKLPDIYPIGNNKLLTKQLIKNDNDYLIDINDIINMIYNIKKNKIMLENYITINGNVIENPKVIKVKKYSYLNNILTNFNFLSNDYDIILNNSLCGKIVNPKNVIIDDNIKGVIINKKSDYKPDKCIKCGLCVNVCPMKINPLKKNKNCIECGLCNYVCPSKINLVDEVQR